MNDHTAISVRKINKTFHIPHQKIDSMRRAFVTIFHKKNYETFKALDNVSFDVHKGEFLGVIGRNGSGKSTLLKILAGIYNADSGEVYINGRISPFLELGIGFNPELSGRDNVYLNATVLGLSNKEIDKKFDSIVNFSEIRRFIDQQVKNYSSGMRVRLAFSVAIHAERDILLMDEVLAVGDMSFQEKCLNIFRNFKNSGKTIILVTHSLDVVRNFCDRALILDRSRIVSDGKPKQIVEEYTRIVNA
jgi:ABC-type polysaccharide/polyol phosphate transport system ATPase subunit